jgi:demethylmenaquinone methyltransferase/2-methoxy-6-polyprenyl-1,4-benzoquinol methylase
LALAEDYERRTTLFPGWRQRLVRLLAPRPGDTVIDVGCGPGLNFSALQSAVGPHGTILALEESPDLLAVAAEQITRRGWDNIKLINTPAHTAHLPVRADAALFATTHDILMSPAALTTILGHLRAGAAIAAGGWKWPAPWLWPLRGLVTALHRPHVTDLTGFDRPWRELADHVSQLHVTEVGFGTGYLARAHVRAPADTAPPRPTAMRPTASGHARRASRGRLGWFLDQVGGVLDPLADQCAGQPPAGVRANLAQNWQAEFGVRLPEPALTNCAIALSEGRPWINTLWTGGW